ncbi:hypothetical protein J1N35_005161 [Gossypium stocksii]|uniref:Reverse transcriptase n=1 Tax=Gossypium stocksii TaxID=47602 RepID=A0A9D4AJ01_9ROSI|nr:hypothetical protein J1N35_005161 [Gossypium stocksii]
MKNGDRNTTFLHQSVTDRRRRNRVEELVDGERNIYKSNTNLLVLATNYFNSLFTSKGVRDPSSILDGVEPCNSPMMNDDLKKDFKSYEPFKSFWGRQFRGDFFQRFWHIVGKDVADFYIETLHGLHNMAEINNTRIVLIPKANAINENLKVYAQCSGQEVNFDKSRIFFSSNVKHNRREEVCRVFEVNRSSNLEKYLGLPTMVGCNTKMAFKELKEKLIKRVSSWSLRLLSMRGREVLIRAVFQAIPLYAMSCFLLPSSICKELEAVIAQFWWQKKAG